MKINFKIKMFVKILLSAMIVLFLWEIILETTNIKMTGFKNHPYLGEIHNNGISIWGKEGYSISYINKLGMRNKEIKPKIAEEYRILALGDSYTEAFQVFENSCYCRVLERTIKNLNKQKLIEVINGGKGGDNILNYIYPASFYEKEIKPDAVVIELNDNDFSPKEIYNSKSFLYLEKNKNSFKLIKNKKFISNNSLRQKYPNLTFLTRFTVLRAGFDNLKTLFKKESSNQDENATKFNTDKSLVEWSVKNLKNAYSNTKIIIVYIPRINYENPNQSINLTGKYLESASANNNIKFINMRNDFLNYYKKYKQPCHGFNNYIMGDGHINENGHKLIAKKLYKYFHEEGLK